MAQSYFSSRVLGLSLAAALIVLPGAAEDWSVKPGGFMQLDYTRADGDKSALSVNQGELRRARLALSGAYGNRFKFKAELNTDSSGEVTLADIWVDFKPEQLGGWSVRTGQFKTPNSLDGLTSARFNSALERSAFTTTFGFDRRLGVAVANKGENWTFSAGVFGENIESNTSDGRAYAARATWTPVHEGETLIHIGGSLRYREQGDTASPVRYRARPYSHVPGRIISSGRVATSDTFIGVEAAGMKGHAWLAGEYGLMKTDCPSCTSGDPDFSAYYVEAGYFIGGHKTYKSGKFNRPKLDQAVTEGGYGAFRVVARFDALGLSDSGIDGGELNTLILGADWWPTDHLRLGANFFNADADLGTITSGLDGRIDALVNAGRRSEAVSGVLARIQFDF